MRAKIIGKASLEGFEPTTRCLEGSCSVQLSYRDKLVNYLIVADEAFDRTVK